jgi:hypothetical protein
MALPNIRELRETNSDTRESLRNVERQPSADTSSASRVPNRAPEVSRAPRSNTSERNARGFERVKAESEASKAANDAAIERSQSHINPMIPLLSKMSDSLNGIEKVLDKILDTLKRQSDLLANSGGGLGLDDLGEGGGDGGNGDKNKKKKKRGSKRQRNRRARELRRQRAARRGGPTPRGRFGGLIKIAGMLGLAGRSSNAQSRRRSR